MVDGSEVVVVGGRKANALVLFGLQMHSSSERASKSVDTLALNDVVMVR